MHRARPLIFFSRCRRRTGSLSGSRPDGAVPCRSLLWFSRAHRASPTTPSLERRIAEPGLRASFPRSVLFPSILAAPSAVRRGLLGPRVHRRDRPRAAAGTRSAAEAAGRSAAETAGSRPAAATAGNRSAVETAGSRSAAETADERSAVETAGSRYEVETADGRAAAETAGRRAAGETAGNRAAGEAESTQDEDA